MRLHWHAAVQRGQTGAYQHIAAHVLEQFRFHVFSQRGIPESEPAWNLELANAKQIKQRKLYTAKYLAHWWPAQPTEIYWTSPNG